MSDVRIDLDGLAATASRARSLASDFDGAERIADDLGSLTGHSGLSSRIEDFGGKWDVAREDLRDSLTSLADFMQAIVDTFRDLDQTMADGGEG